MVLAIWLIVSFFTCFYAVGHIPRNHSETIKAARKECQYLFPLHPPRTDRLCFVRREHRILKADAKLQAVQQLVVNYSLQSETVTRARQIFMCIFMHTSAHPDRLQE